MTGAKILLVEDDQGLASLVVEYLGREGLPVEVLHTGAGAVERILADPPDLVILDWMLPGEDGLSICRRLRPGFPGAVMMLTARGDEVDQVVGLEVGADDYLPKPVSPRLLAARVRALLRRRPGAASPEPLALGALVVDRGRREATLEGRDLALTTAEFDLLWLLSSSAGQVVDRETLFQELRGIPYDGLDRAIDVLASRLRQKLEAAPGQPRRLKSVRGVGYMLTAG